MDHLPALAIKATFDAPFKPMTAKFPGKPPNPPQPPSPEPDGVALLVVMNLSPQNLAM